MLAEDLITEYIDSSSSPSEARLRKYGVHVWALIGYLRAVGDNVDQVAADYEVPRAAVEAAIAYYQRHRANIDARLILNAE